MTDFFDQPQPGGEQLIDIPTALERVGDDWELLRDVAQLFVDDYPNSLAAMHVAINEQNASKLEAAAHTLKGSVANFGASRVVELAMSLEQLGRANNLDDAPATLEQLEAALALLKPQLQNL